MTAPDLQTASENVKLIAPNIERDAELSVTWMSGEGGRDTQMLMGVADHDIHEHSQEEAEALIQSFIESEDELAWMIEHDGRVVGALEVHQVETDFLPSPSVHIMIGEPAARQQGVGTSALAAAVSWLQVERDEDIIFSRYRTSNLAAAHLLMKVGFENDGEPYRDRDDISWQNVIIRKLY